MRPSWGGLSNYVNSGTGQGYQQSIRPQSERPKVLASSRHWHRQIHRIPKGDSLVIAEPGGRGGADPERSGSIPLGLPPERTSSSPRGPDSFKELRTTASAARAKLREPLHSPVPRAVSRPRAAEGSGPLGARAGYADPAPRGLARARN